MSETFPNRPASARQLRLLAVILLPILAVLLAAYFFLFRSDYAVLARDLRADEAAAIVAELKKQDVSFELQQQGSTILVPAAQADEFRLSIASGGIAEPGSVGFELFNESDMGLTDFAQKVNYQRALQGELARTIMGMDGIAFARVHLALPERSLFRANRSAPRAAVTVVPKPNIMLDAGRVAGIQRLVASTVTDLAVEDVAVLNQRGQLMTPEPGQAASDRMANASALEKAYAERIGRAINTFAPELSFDLKVTTVQLPSGVDDSDGVEPTGRDHAVRVVVFTALPIGPEQQADLSRLIAQLIDAKRETGDDIQFSLTPPPTSPSYAAPVPTEAPVAKDVDVKPEAIFAGRWLEGVTLAFALVMAGLSILVVRRRRLIRREQLVVRIRDQLRIEQVVA